MTEEIRCKRIIDSKTYNTETASLLGQWEAEFPFEQALFKTRYGSYFLYELDDSIPDERIKPLEPHEAQKWMEDHCRAESIEKEFGEMPEAGDPEARITLRIPETLRKRLANIAEGRKQSLNAWIQRCLERCAAEAETPRCRVRHVSLQNHQSPITRPSPSQVNDVFWLYAERKDGSYPNHTENGGKWLIFVPIPMVDEVWEKELRPRLSGKPVGLGGHLKSGQWWSPQNRPMRKQSGQVIFLPWSGHFGKW